MWSDVPATPFSEPPVYPLQQPSYVTVPVEHSPFYQELPYTPPISLFSPDRDFIRPTTTYQDLITVRRHINFE